MMKLTCCWFNPPFIAIWEISLGCRGEVLISIDLTSRFTRTTLRAPVNIFNMWLYNIHTGMLWPLLAHLSSSLPYACNPYWSCWNLVPHCVTLMAQPVSSLNPFMPEAANMLLLFWLCFSHQITVWGKI